MKWLALAGMLFLAGCTPPVSIDTDSLFYADPPSEPLEVPMVNVPVVLRQANYDGPDEAEGSCVHASMVTAFHQQGQSALAAYWRNRYGDGEWADETYNKDQNLVQKFEEEGVPYAYVINGDVEFLEWACRTRRGCGVAVNGGRHMVFLAHLDSEWAGLIDNNQTQDLIWVSRQRFISEWHASMGWAVTPVYDPVPPIPRS